MMGQKLKRIAGFTMALAMAVSMQGISAFAAQVSEEGTLAVPGYQAVSTTASQALAEHIKNMDVTFDMSQYGLSKQDFSDTYDDTVFNNPLLFYADGCSYTTVNGIATKVTMRYTDSRESAAAKLAEIERAAAGALSCINPNMSTVEKVAEVHNYLALTCAYDMENLEANTLPNEVYNVYGALVSHKAVCQGYSLAFKLLMDRLGIPCVTVQSDSMNHMWNAVQIDGAWYHVDVTWDDPTPDVLGQYGHNMLLVSDVKASSPKNAHTDWYGIPEAAYSTALDNMDWKTFIAEMRNKYFPNTGVVTDTSAYTMPAGGTYTFKAKATPGQILLAKSEDAGLARVEFLYAEPDGSWLFKITALKEGTTAVSVHSESGVKTQFPLTVTAAADGGQSSSEGIDQQSSTGAYVCDTTSMVTLQPGQAYHFKLTWTQGGTPVFPNASTGSGSFRVDLVKKEGNSAYYKVTASANALPGEETGVYIIPNGGTPSMQFRVGIVQNAAA